MSLQDKLNKIKKKQAKTFVDLSKPPEPIDVIPTGSLVLDHVLGIGGWPRGRVVEVCGEFSSSKTTFALHASAEAVALDLHAVYLDFEHAMDLLYPENLGLDIQSPLFHLLRPKSMEEGLDIVEDLLTEEGLGLVVIDSVSMATPQDIIERTKAGNALGLHSRLYQGYLDRLCKAAAESNTCIFQTNQLRTSIDTRNPYAGKVKKTSGGKSVEFLDSIKVELSPFSRETTKIVDEITHETIEVPVREKVRVFTEKNKLSAPKKTGSLWVEYGQGINNGFTIADMAVARGVIEEKGGGRFRASFEYGSWKEGDQVAHGRNQLYPLVSGDLDFQDFLINTMIERGQFNINSSTFKVVNGRVSRSKSVQRAVTVTNMAEDTDEYEEVEA